MSFYTSVAETEVQISCELVWSISRCTKLPWKMREKCPIIHLLLKSTIYLLINFIIYYCCLPPTESNGVTIGGMPLIYFTSDFTRQLNREMFQKTQEMEIIGLKYNIMILSLYWKWGSSHFERVKDMSKKGLSPTLWIPLVC